MSFTMNKQEKYDEDLLRQFINPRSIEKAPEGFTSKTLARIKIETQTSGLKKGFLMRNRVPLISASVIAAFVIAAIAIPSNESGSIGPMLWNYLNDFEFNLPAMSDLFSLDLSLPGWTIYVAILLLLLVFFDRALFSVFHKEHN